MMDSIFIPIGQNIHLPEAKTANYLWIVAVVTIGACIIDLFSRRLSLFLAFRNLPVVNPKPWYFSGRTALRAWAALWAPALIEAEQKYDEPFVAYTIDGQRIILPHRYLDAMKSHPNLSLDAFIRKKFNGPIPGFDPWSAPGVADRIHAIAAKWLTHNLARFAEPLSEAAIEQLEKGLTRSTEWHEVQISDVVQKTTAFIVSQLFCGSDLANNEEWLEICRAYARQRYTAQHAILTWNPIFRPFIHYVLPETRKLKALYRRAGEILYPVVEARRREVQGTAKQGETPAGQGRSVEDILAWNEQMPSAVPYDHLHIQLLLVFLGVSSVSGLAFRALTHVAAYGPKLVEELRSEIVQVMPTASHLEKQDFSQVLLLDSMLRETLRLEPADESVMERVTTAPFDLPDGSLRIPAGVVISISNSKLHNPNSYPDPLKWNPYRHLEKRKIAGNEQKAQFVTTDENFSSWGYGRHSCPGRFFAGLVLKIFMSQLLRNWDVRLVQGEEIKVPLFGRDSMLTDTPKVEVRWVG